MSIFSYGYQKRLDTNKALAAHRWATLGDQTEIEPKIVIYVYENEGPDGVKIETVGGKYILLNEIFNRVIDRQANLPRGQRDVVRLIYKGNNANVDEDELEKEDLQEKAVGNRNKGGNMDSTLEYYSKGSIKNVIPKLKQGYDLDYSAMPVTTEIWSRACDELLSSNASFDENRNTEHAESGANYKISKFVISKFFQRNRENKTKSWIEKQLLEIFDGVNLKDAKLRQSLTTINKDGEEIIDNEVEEKASSMALDGVNLILENQSFKEIFCTLAIVNQLFSGYLWELIQVILQKRISTKSNDYHEEDAKLKEFYDSLDSNTAILLKDCKHGKKNIEIFKQHANEQNWVFTAIQNAVNWCSAINIELRIEDYESTFLHRTDLIRECTTAKEFLDMVRDWKPEYTLTRTRDTREAFIAEKINLRENYSYLTLNDVQRLAMARMSELNTLITEINKKIEETKRNIDTFEDRIKENEATIQMLRSNLSTNTGYGPIIRLQSDKFNLGNYAIGTTFSGVFRQSNIKNTQAERRIVRIGRNGLDFYDYNDNPIKNMQGVKPIAFRHWYLAELEEILNVLTDEQREQKIAQIREYEVQNEELRYEIEKHQGRGGVYNVRYKTKPTQLLENNCYVRNKVLNLLRSKYNAWYADKVAFVSEPIPKTDPAFNTQQYYRRLLTLGKSNLDRNLAEAKIRSSYSFGGRQQATVAPDSPLAPWFLRNKADNANLYQKLDVLYITKDGDKKSKDTNFMATKYGFYVIMNKSFQFMIPMWYACLSNVKSVQDSFYSDIKFYASTFDRMTLNIVMAMDRICENAKPQGFETKEDAIARELEVFSDMTGIMILTKDEAYDIVTSLQSENCIYDIDNQYIDSYVSLATYADIKLEKRSVYGDTTSLSTIKARPH